MGRYTRNATACGRDPWGEGTPSVSAQTNGMLSSAHLSRIDRSNRLKDWQVKLIVTCREEHMKSYGNCLGPHPPILYLQGFGEVQIEEYVQRRVRAWRFQQPSDVSVTRAQRPALVRTRRRSTISAVALRMTPDGAAAAVATAAAAVGASLAVMASVDAADRQRDREIMTRIATSPIRPAFSTPFKLMIGMDLMMAGALEDIHQECYLYEGWLNQQFASRGTIGSEELQEVWRQAERLAWDLHMQGSTHEEVGDRGKEDWFRRLPLRIHDYGPDGIFSYQHKSLQEYLVGMQFTGLALGGDHGPLMECVPPSPARHALPKIETTGRGFWFFFF